MWVGACLGASQNSLNALSDSGQGSGPGGPLAYIHECAQRCDKDSDARHVRQRFLSGKTSYCNISPLWDKSMLR